MSEAEAQEFIGQRLRFLKIERLLSDAAQLEPLIAATGGNPKAIEIALGLVKHERRPLQQVVADLYAARGALFDDLFTRAWALLDQATRHVLLVTTFFPDSAGGEALAATADVQGFAFDRAIERLIDLALLDVHQEDLDSAPRYMLHPLVRAFAGARMAEQPGFEAEARERWVERYAQLASEVGHCWDELDRLELLDSEQEVIYSVVQWASQALYHTKVIKIARGIDYYYYIRGYWDKRLAIELLWATSADQLGDFTEESEARAYYIQVLAKQGNLPEADKHVQRLLELDRAHCLSTDVFYEYQHAIALYWMELGDLDAAQQAWEQSVSDASDISTHRYVGSRRWLAACLYQKGMIEQAQQLFLEALDVATRCHYTRGIIAILSKLALFELDQGNIEKAEVALVESSALAYKYLSRWDIAVIQRTYARLHALRGDHAAAHAALAEAIDLFERLGMRRELAEARAELADLNR
jgi:LuxR family glucitol operon transcriptional activator